MAQFVQRGWRPMMADDLKRIAEHYTELIKPGQWADMADAQSAVSPLHVRKPLQAALLGVFMARSSPVRVLVIKIPINIKPSHEGKFHERTGTPQGQEIPMGEIRQGERSPDPAVRKEARFADNARHWSHNG